SSSPQPPHVRGRAWPSVARRRKRRGTAGLVGALPPPSPQPYPKRRRARGALEGFLRRVQIAGAVVDDGDDAHGILKRAFGRWHALGLTGIDRNRAAKRASAPLEARFGDVMAVGAVKRLDVQRDACVAGEGLEELAHQLSVKS